MHGNELSFRYLFNFLDGKTTDPSTFNGPIGPQLNKTHHLLVIDFKLNGSGLLDLKGVDLSTDQKYLYKMVQAISKENCSPSLADKYSGKQL